MPEWRYRGRTVTTEEIDFIRRLITDYPTASRRRLSEKLCEAWQWKQANGAPRDMVCRGLLLMLDRAGQIELPGIRFRPPNPLARRERPQAMLIDTTPLNGALADIRPVSLQQVRTTAGERRQRCRSRSHLCRRHRMGRRHQHPPGKSVRTKKDYSFLTLRARAFLWIGRYKRTSRAHGLISALRRAAASDRSATKSRFVWSDPYVESLSEWPTICLETGNRHFQGWRRLTSKRTRAF
jgi:hypothetical protein